MERYSCPILPLEISQLKLSTVDVYCDEVIGQGSFGNVCRAKCDQLPCVAKIMLLTEATEEELLDVQMACQLLSAVRHPNIVQCFGTARWGLENHPIILMEEIEENLAHFLERHSTELSQIPYYVKVNILYDVAFGMAYLHFSDIIHGNLSANNILIVGESRAKITDFWIMKITESHPTMQSSKVEPSKVIYMSPEVRTQQSLPFTKQSDAYSFGVVTILVDTQKITKLYQHDDTQKSITSEIKPASPFAKVANGCLESDPFARPEFKDICEDLVMLKRYSSYATDREASRGECEHLKRRLTTRENEIDECKLQLQRKDREIAGMKMAMAGLEQAILDIRKEKKELARICEEHKAFERHLLQLPATDSSTIQHYKTVLGTPADPTDEPDLPVLLSSAHPDTEIHKVCECCYTARGSAK